MQLELSYNPIGAEGAKALCEVLKFHGKVQTLKLGWCQVFHSCIFIFHKFFSLFLESSLDNCTLFKCGTVFLVLSLLQIGALGAQYVADCLKYNMTISTLDLRANGLGDEVIC